MDGYRSIPGWKLRGHALLGRLGQYFIGAKVVNEIWYTIDKYSSVGHAVLGLVGLVWDGADLINAVWYALDGDLDMAVTSAICALPFVGSMIGGTAGLATQIIGCGMLTGMFAANTYEAVKTVVDDYLCENADLITAICNTVVVVAGVVLVGAIAYKVIQKTLKVDYNDPEYFLKKALKKRGTDYIPSDLNETWIENNYKYTVRTHPGNPKYTDADLIYRVSRQKTITDNATRGSGLEYLGLDKNWYHKSILREFYKGNVVNPNFNEAAARMTHIPIKGGN